MEVVRSCGLDPHERMVDGLRSGIGSGFLSLCFMVCYKLRPPAHCLSSSANC